MQSSVEQMILNADSEDGEHPAIELSEDFKSCFNAETAGACGKQIIVNTIDHGEIIPTTPNTPKNHTASISHKLNP